MSPAGRVALGARVVEADVPEEASSGDSRTVEDGLSAMEVGLMMSEEDATVFGMTTLELLAGEATTGAVPVIAGAVPLDPKV